jgi:hypothetical protein
MTVIRQLVEGERRGCSQEALLQQGLGQLQWCHVEAALIKFKGASLAVSVPR